MLGGLPPISSLLSWLSRHLSRTITPMLVSYLVVADPTTVVVYNCSAILAISTKGGLDFVHHIVIYFSAYDPFSDFL